jgi:hypothetical protein
MCRRAYNYSICKLLFTQNKGNTTHTGQWISLVLFTEMERGLEWNLRLLKLF